MKPITFRIATAFTALATLSTCNIINPAEEIPGYVYITEFQVQTNSATQGSNSARITEAWLNVDGNFLGAWSLPALVPVLGPGEHQVILQPGIKDNGINSSPEIYVFYTDYQTTVDLSPNEVDTIRPVVTYRSEAKFAFIEGFESDSHIFQDMRFGGADHRIRLTDSDVFEGNYSGVLTLDTDQPIVEIATIQRFSDLDRGLLVYLEMNYKSDIPVVFGLVGHRSGETGSGQTAFDPGFLPTEQWSKIYFNLSPLFFDGNFDEYQIVLLAAIPIVNGQLSRPSAKVWFDNVKLVHY
jgi:hypothetical protein